VLPESATRWVIKCVTAWNAGHQIIKGLYMPKTTLINKVLVELGKDLFINIIFSLRASGPTWQSTL
jgi:hypothetical protein